uniref:Uncharacterized protein n=1 Tax=Physcomitrium patens TaxID=3218 RepID=A9SEZ8_PHYPA|nr:hypothetical protein PHYPA_007077 [Physcomitrium patens]
MALYRLCDMLRALGSCFGVDGGCGALLERLFKMIVTKHTSLRFMHSVCALVFVWCILDLTDRKLTKMHWCLYSTVSVKFAWNCHQNDVRRAFCAEIGTNAEIQVGVRRRRIVLIEINNGANKGGSLCIYIQLKGAQTLNPGRKNLRL